VFSLNIVYVRRHGGLRNWAGIPTLTIPATKAPQLNAPMSFGTEMNLIKQKGCQVGDLWYKQNIMNSKEFIKPVNKKLLFTNHVFIFMFCSFLK
jgi:hypothetical protein